MPLHNEGEWWGAERERGEGEGQNNLRELTDQLAKKKKKKCISQEQACTGMPASTRWPVSVTLALAERQRPGEPWPLLVS